MEYHPNSDVSVHRDHDGVYSHPGHCECPTFTDRHEHDSCATHPVPDHHPPPDPPPPPPPPPPHH